MSHKDKRFSIEDAFTEETVSLISHQSFDVDLFFLNFGLTLNFELSSAPQRFLIFIFLFWKSCCKLGRDNKNIWNNNHKNSTKTKFSQ